MTKERVTKGIFWLGFIAFLATSVPHVAWLYHIYEPENDVLWWILAYAIAISIDVLIAWLSFVQSAGDRTANGVTWFFISCLCLLSWYANYLYSIAHSPTPVRDLWGMMLPFTGMSTGQVTPAIVSALPVFVIAYTFMLHIVNNTAHETLEQKATRLETTRKARERIREATKGSLTNRVKDAITSAGDIASHAKSSLNVSRNVVETSKAGEGSNTPVPSIETPIDSLQTQETPIVKEVIPETSTQIQTPTEDDRHTEALVAVSVSSNGHSTVDEEVPLQRYVPKSQR